MPKKLTIGLINLFGMTVLVGVLFFFALFFFRSPCADYTPRELILNCFKSGEIRGPFCVSPEQQLLVAARYGKLCWITNWDDKTRVEIVGRHLDFGTLIKAIAFSGDGTRVAVCIEDQTIKPVSDRIGVFEVATRELITKWETPSNGSGAKMILSHDGSVLISETFFASDKGSFQALNIWNTSTSRQLASIKIPEDTWLGDFAFYRDRLVLAYEHDEHRIVSIYECQPPYAQPKLMSEIKSSNHLGFGSSALSADGSLVAANIDERIKVYEVIDGKLFGQINENGGTSCSDFPGYVFSPDRRFLAVPTVEISDNKLIHIVNIWSISSEKKLGTLRGFGGSVCPVAFAPKGKTLITSDSDAVAVWDISGFVNNSD